MPEPHIPLLQNKEFKAIKNAVIQEARNILYDRVTFEEAVSEPEEPPAETPVPKSKWNDSDNLLFQYCKAKMHLDKDSPLYNPVELTPITVCRHGVLTSALTARPDVSGSAAQK